MIYLWRIPKNSPNSLIGEYDKRCSPDRFLFFKGKRIGECNPLPSFTFAAEPNVLKKYDVLPNSTMVPLVSERIAKILTREAENDVELIPSIVNSRDEHLPGYSLVNILPRVASVDHFASKFVFIPGTEQIMKFIRLSLKLNALGSHQLAREIEYNAFILVSEDLKTLFESAEATGCEFISPEEIKP